MLLTARLKQVMLGIHHYRNNFEQLTSSSLLTSNVTYIDHVH
jgi:hypothetical protein